MFGGYPKEEGRQGPVTCHGRQSTDEQKILGYFKPKDFDTFLEAFFSN